MPVYEYICSSCGHPFDKMVRFSDTNPDTSCPKCKSTETRKRLSRIAYSSYSSANLSGGSCGSSSSGFS